MSTSTGREEEASNGQTPQANSKSDISSTGDIFPSNSENIIDVIPACDITSRTDAFLTCLQSCASTRAGTDTILLFLLYTFRLSGNVLEALGHAAALGRIKPRLPKWSHPLAMLLLRLAKRCTAVVAMIGNVRAFGRLWGLLGIYFSAKKLVSSLKKPPSDRETSSRVSIVFQALQILLLASFHATDNLVHLTLRKVLRFSSPAVKTLSRVSIRSWALYVFVDLARLLSERQKQLASGGDEAAARKNAAWSAQWQKNFLRSLSWSPIALHRVMETGLLNDTAISLFGLYPATSKMRELWLSNSTAR